jgi:hypothetical protein
LASVLQCISLGRSKNDLLADTFTGVLFIIGDYLLNCL